MLAVTGNCGVIVTSQQHKNAPDEWQDIASLSIAREVGDHRNGGNHLGKLGHAYSSLGQFQQAIGTTSKP